MELTEKQLNELTDGLTHYCATKYALKIIAEHFDTKPEFHEYLADVLEAEDLYEYLERVSDNLGCVRKEKVQQDIKEWRQDLKDWLEQKNNLSPEERLIQAVFGPPPKGDTPE